MTTGTQKKPTNKVDPKIELTWNVMLFNCYCHTFDEAAEAVMSAIGCGYSKGCDFARAAEANGSVTVYSGTLGECERVARILGSTGLMVSVAQ